MKMFMTHLIRLFLPALLSAASLLTAASPEPAKKPKLVVGIVIDQFRYDYLLKFQKDYNAGLARLMKDGAVFTDAHYVHSNTVTAIGHSTFLSGAPPSASGIIANEWYERSTGKTVTSVSDPQTKLLGAPGDAGSSPRRLLVSTIGDEIKMQGLESKTIGISIKDRSAILPSGHMANAAYWVDVKTNNWVSSTYYMQDLPDWVMKANEEQWAKPHLKEKWFPFDAKGGNAKPFCSMVKEEGLRACGSLEATPWGNEMIEMLAERALANENLGHHPGIDLLTVSFSSNDYVGHAVGPDDPAVRDISIRTDRLIGKLLAYADQKVGAGNYLVVLTADHGVAPVPEVNQARHMPGGRLADATIVAAMTNALVKKFGEGKWFVATAATMPYLNQELIQSKGLDPAAVEKVAAAAAKLEAHIARVYTRHEIASGEVQRDAIGNAVSLGYFGPRFGDLYILQDPYYLFGKTGTSHGTPYGYDTHVPVIFMGPQVKGGVYSTPIIVNDIATTLASLLGVDPPSGSIGKVLNIAK